MTTIDYNGTQDLDNAVVRFTAEWCGPCKAFAPIFDKIAEQSNDRFIVVDVDEHPDAAKNYNVMSIPTVVVHSVKQADYMDWAKHELSNSS